MSKHKVFISYHHDNDKFYKDILLELNKKYDIFIDMSVDTGDIDDDLSDETIRTIIRDEYLRDSSVTILLVGSKTKYRKHIDWEIYSSMYNGKINKKSGILVIQLPTINPPHIISPCDEEKRMIYSDISSWTTKRERGEYEERYPCLPDRIIDNLAKKDVNISVTKWEYIDNNPENLRILIECAYKNRITNNYDLGRSMRKYSIEKECI